MSNNAQVTIRLTEDLRNQLENEAKKLEMTISQLIRAKLSAKHISKPKFFIDSNIILTFEQLSKGRVIYEDVLV